MSAISPSPLSSGEGSTDLPVHEESDSHIVRRACGMKDIAAGVFENTICHHCES